MRNPQRYAEDFKLIFSQYPQYLGCAPGRVTIIGAHMDYNGGTVICAALPVGTTVCIGANTKRRLRIVSEQQKHSADLAPGELAICEELIWTRYIVGVLLELGLADSAFDIYISSDLSMGRGLGSSAALTCATATALLPILGKSKEIDLVELCQRIEHRYLSVYCGILDPYSAINASPGRLLRVNCASLQHQYLDFPEDIAIIVCDSAIGRELVAGMYNSRRAECLQLAQNIGKKWLAELRPGEFEGLAGNYSPSALKRAKHVVDEAQRVWDFERALESGDYNALRKIMSASHVSCRDLLECSIPELDFLVQTANSFPECMGARLTGAGWGGATVNLVWRNSTEEFCNRLRQAYEAQFGRRASFLVVNQPGVPAYGTIYPIFS